MVISLQKAEMVDCKKIHEMQVEAFSELLNKYKDYNTNPAAESVESIEEKMAQDFTDYYFICLDSVRIGAIRILRLKNDVCRISPMFILSEYQGKGYAQKAILNVEQLYPQVKIWQLETIKEEAKLRHVYEKMCYKATGKEEEIQKGMTIIYYAK